MIIFYNFSNIDTQTLINMCSVSQIWRLIINSCYVWRKLAKKCKMVGINECSDLQKSESMFSPLCDCGVQVKKKLKWKRNFSHGKYVKRFLPSLHTNIFEETEKFSSCISLDSGRLVFGSREGSIVIWKPSSDKKHNLFKKHKISNSVIDLAHLHKSRLLLIESGNVHIFFLDDDLNIQLLESYQTGESNHIKLLHSVLFQNI